MPVMKAIRIIPLLLALAFAGCATMNNDATLASVRSLSRSAASVYLLSHPEKATLLSNVSGVIKASSEDGVIDANEVLYRLAPLVNDDPRTRVFIQGIFAVYSLWNARMGGTPGLESLAFTYLNQVAAGVHEAALEERRGQALTRSAFRTLDDYTLAAQSGDYAKRLADEIR